MAPVSASAAVASPPVAPPAGSSLASPWARKAASLARVLLVLTVVGVAWEVLVVAFSVKPHYVPRLSVVLHA